MQGRGHDGFAVDELNSALEASVRETRRERKPSSSSGGGDVSAEAGGVDPGAGPEPLSPPESAGASATGLRNLEGEYNCFLNVVVQSLWHLPAFRAAVERSGAWRCADAGDAAGFFSSRSGESGKSGEKKKTDESDALRAFGLSEASVQWGNQLLCERAPRRDE